MIRQDDLHCFVEPGDTWDSIAATLSMESGKTITKADLRRANGWPTSLQVGSMIHAPLGSWP